MRARTRVLAAAATVTLVGTLGVAGAGAANAAAITSGASAYSAGAGSGTGTLGANLQLSGSLGKLLDGLISPIVSSTLNPLVSAIQGTANGLVAGLLGVSSPLKATTSAGQSQYPTAPATFPSDALPSPCSSSGNQPCYTAAGVTLSAPPLITANVGAVTGYVEQVAAAGDATLPIFGRATVASTSVSVLPGITGLVPALPTITNPLVTTGIVASKANCPNDGAVGASKPVTAPSASESVTGVKLLGGLITFDALDGRLTNLSVNGTAYGTVLNLPTLTISGITVAPYGNAVMVTIPLTLAQVLAGLGVTGSLASSLGAIGLNSTMALRLVLGPNSTLTPRSASAWGLGVGVDLSGALTFNLLNLVTATVNVPTGITGGNNGNLLDLRLATTSCQSGVVLPAVVPVVPPALV